MYPRPFQSDRDESLLPAVMNSDLNLHEAF